MAVTYSAVTSGEKDAESPLTASLADKWTNNLLAVIENDPTAPEIDGAAITNLTIPYAALNLSNSIVAGDIATDAVGQPEVAASAIGQGELKVATNNQELTLNSDTYGTITPTGGSWTHSWFMFRPASTGTNNTIRYTDNNITTAATTVWGFYNFSGSNSSIGVYTQYFTASEPYDLGDGQTALFVYLLIDNATNKIEAKSVAPDPAWAYNASKTVRPDRWKIEGTKKNPVKIPYIDLPQPTRSNTEIFADLKKGGALRDKALEEIRNPSTVEVKLTMAVKNTYMNEVPHPFMNQDLTGKTVLLLDPACKCIDELRVIHDEGIPENSVIDMIDNDYIRFGNTRLNRVTPNGVMIVAPKWRLT